MPATPVLLDVDTGTADAHALLLALRHPALEVRGVTTVAGNLDPLHACLCTPQASARSTSVLPSAVLPLFTIDSVCYPGATCAAVGSTGRPAHRQLVCHATPVTSSLSVHHPCAQRQQLLARLEAAALRH